MVERTGDDYDSYEKIYIDGWKGKGSLEIIPNAKGYRLIHTEKNKETGDIEKITGIALRVDVEFLWHFVKRYAIGKRVKARRIWKYIIESKNIHVIEKMTVEQMLNAFYGGTNRHKYYFPLYYNPMKVLEDKKYVQYFGSGACARLVEGEFVG